MDQKIREIFEQVLQSHYIKKGKVGLWILEGDEEKSFVGISEEEPVNYQIFFYRQEKENLTEKQWKVLFHEIAHILDFEKTIQDKGMAYAREEIKKYEQEVERLRAFPEKEKQMKYQQIEMERKANLKAEIIYNEMKEREWI